MFVGTQIINNVFHPLTFMALCAFDFMEGRVMISMSTLPLCLCVCFACASDVVSNQNVCHASQS